VPRSRRPLLWPLFVLAAALVAVGLAMVVGDGDADDADDAGSPTTEPSEDGETEPPELDRVGSEEVRVGGTVTAAERVPLTYRVTYRARLPGAEPTTEVVTLRRPFESRVEVWQGPAASGERLSLQESSFGLLAVATSTQAPVVTVVGPAVASPDLRFDVALPAALEQGLLERREIRRVAGRLCQVYRAGTSVSAGQLVAPTDDEYADACVDGEGLLLEEWWVTEGRTVRQRVAVAVETGVDVDDSLFTLPRDPTVPAEDGGGGIRRLAEGSAPPGEFFEVGTPPAGMSLLGRFAVVPTQPQQFTDPARQGDILATTADVWVRGADFVVVDQGGALGSSEVYAPDPELPHAAVGALGEAELHMRLDRLEVRIHLDGNRFVRVYGTVPVDDLLAVARSLRRTEGSGIAFADEPG
jgi:hypothetical protein